MFAPPVARTKAKTTSATAPSHAPKTGRHVTQPNRVLGDVDDLLAQEAARPSGQVMRSHIPARPASSLAERATLLQRACACGGGCSKCQVEQLGQEHERLQTKRLQPGNMGQEINPATRTT